MANRGETYKMRHDRFGVATVKVLAVDDSDPKDVWYDIEVVSGTLHGASRGAQWGPGDQKAVRGDHCTFAPP